MQTKFPFWNGGPNHDNTTNFGDSVLLQYDADGSQSLIFLDSYWVIGHLSKFARPGASVVTMSGSGAAATPADYDAIRSVALGQSSNASLPLMAIAFTAPGAASASCVVANPNAAPRTFKLVDADAALGAQAVIATLPPHSIATYTWPTQ